MAFQNGSVGFSRLHFAAKFGHIQTCIEILGKNPDNKNPLTNDGISPLHLAAENGHFRICEMLLESGIEDKNYVAHETTKRFWKNSHFENMRAGFHRRCQNSLRQTSPEMVHIQA